MPNHSNRNRDETNSNNTRRGDAGVIRSGSHGRMLREPPQPAPNVEGYRKASSGRFVGFDLVDPALDRTDSGQLRNVRDEQQLSRRELRARYGHHNSGERNFDQMSEPETSDTPTFDRGVFADVSRTEAAARGVDPNPTDRRESIVADGLGGPQFNRHVGGFVETDRPDEETTPPDIQRGEDPFVSAESERGRSGPDLFESADSQLRDEDRSVVREGFADAVESFDEIDETDRDEFFSQAAELQSEMPTLQRGDTLAVNTTNTLLAERRGGSL